LKKILVADQAKCTGCRSCEVWCSFNHFKDCNPSRARLQVIAYEDRGVFIPNLCYHCRDAWCLNECPANAITRNPETKALDIDDSMCTGCLSCVDACPFGIIKVNKAGDVYKCDLCQGNPVCVQSCTRSALTYTEVTKAYLDSLTELADKAGGTV